MKRARRRKCLCCGELFRPDARNLRHQRHCGKARVPQGQQGGESAPLARESGEPRLLPRGDQRGAGAGLARRASGVLAPSRPPKRRLRYKRTPARKALKHIGDSDFFAPAALQEVLAAQPTVLIGLIAHLTDSALQEDIARASRRLLQLGHDILRGTHEIMTIKRVLVRERVRQIPAQFSWLDQRLVRDRHIERCDPQACALYLFLVTVADAQGLSYYSEASMRKRLSMAPARLAPRAPI